MTSVERVKAMCKERKIAISRLEKDLGFSNGYIGQLRKGVFPDDRLRMIADYFGVALEYLTGDTENDIGSPCPDCGMSYNANDPEDARLHSERHKAWEKAEKQFGRIYANYSTRERIKADNRNIRDDASKPLNERIAAEIEVLRCLFSRSVARSGFDLNHVPFEQYISMMNKNPTYEIPQEIRDALVKKYGTEDGISSGTYYIPQKQIQTAAAHLDASDLTDKELADVQKYIDFIKTKRGK